MHLCTWIISSSMDQDFYPFPFPSPPKKTSPLFSPMGTFHQVGRQHLSNKNSIMMTYIVNQKSQGSSLETPIWCVPHLLLVIGESLFTFSASLTYTLHHLMKLWIWILKEHNNFSYLWKFEQFRRSSLLKLEILQRMFCSFMFLPPGNFAVLDGWYFFKYCSQWHSKP